ncbi:SDR family oxidoreductase [Williamsoniiplasma lucivorax]|uniref:Oxidoreductase n=1 Tax=Williamsoniiplasma lucivorax TaxID=209274 RepID=A0A2S5RCU1_9MOLU|nr:SDR family oxidoreductase [Williamsoniiplasma lucivorax]PPE05118.1 oxidoreductase [Williamsoniiplasma lucivorax]
MKPTKPLVAITGASSGIGKATAELFAAQGYPVLLMARRVHLLDALDIEHKVTAQVDVTDIVQMRDAIKKAEAIYGPVDLLVNNAGIMPMDKYVDQSLDDKYATLDVNIKGVVNGMDCVLKAMNARQHGTIVNLSSVAGRWTSIDHALYNGAKTAVNAITEQARRENGENNVRFILIEPGMVDTNLLDTTTNQEVLGAYLVHKNRLQGGLAACDIADAILYTYQLPQHINIKELLITHTKQKI